MSHELKEGVPLKSIITIPDPEEGSHAFCVGDKPYFGAREIRVVMQPGQMGMVPWARVELNDGKVVLYNLANVESVELLDVGGES